MSDFVRAGGLDASFSVFPGQIGSGLVQAILRQPDGKVLIGGSFTSITGAALKNVARLNADGSPDLSFNPGTGADGPVSKIHLQPDGKILVSGQFLTFNNLPRQSIARLNPDGSVDASFNNIQHNGTTARVGDIQPDGRILVYGDFTSFNGVQRKQIVRLNSLGALDTSFDFGTGASNFVSLVRLVPDGKILVSGIFSTINGTPREGFARLNNDGTLDASFTPAMSISNALDLQFLPDGRFTVIGFNNGDRVVRYNADGSLDATFNSDNQFQSGPPRSLALQPDGKILVGGDFSFVRVGTVTRGARGITRLNNDGSFDMSFTSPMTSGSSFDDVYAVGLQPDGKMIIGGNFQQIQNSGVGTLAKINGDGSLDNSYLGLIIKRETVFAQYSQPDGKLLLGGDFNILNTSNRKFIGRLNPNGETDASFVPDAAIDKTIMVIVRQPDGKYLLGADGDGVGNRLLWRANPDGSLDSSFNAVTFNTSGFITAIALEADGKILIAGGFNTVNGASRNGFARLSADGGLDPLTVEAGGIKSIVVQADGRIVLGGGFSSVNGAPGTGKVARLNADGSVDSGFTPNTGGSFFTVLGVYQIHDRLHVAGTFNGTANNSRNGLIRLNANGTVDLSFNGGTILGQIYSAAALPNRKILVGGDFRTSSFSGNRRYAVRLIENGALDYAFDAGTFGFNAGNPPISIFQVAAAENNKAFVAGSFDSVAGQTRWSVARLNDEPCVPRARADYDGDDITDISVFRPSDGVWYRLDSFNNTFRALQFGSGTDKPAPADYDGDGRTDIAVFRPSDGTWYIINSSNGSFRFEQFGISEDIPFPIDRDGDGRADLNVFRPSNGTWYSMRSTQGFTAIQFGQQGDVPVAADYDGDCKADISVWRPADGVWYRINSLDGQFITQQFGTSGDKPVAADYDGDGKADRAVYRPDTGTWFLLGSQAGFTAAQFGIATDKPVPGDYDGDGKTDLGVYRDNTWYLLRSTAGYTGVQFGAAGDKPVPGAFNY
ncbi:MAG TPA: FG-GAP-like repeat-containing protein [Pyrinomonadaceae bacterium]